MPGTVLNFEEEKLLRSYDKIGKAIIDYISNMGLVWEVEIARRVYFGSHMDAFAFDKSGMGYKPFIQWLIFSYKIMDDKSLIDCICDEYLHKMSNYEKDALMSLKNTNEGLYKVYSVSGDEFLVKDVFSNEEAYVMDNHLAQSLKRYTGIFMRMVKINNKNIPIPGYAVMSNAFLKDIEQYIEERFRQFQHFNSKCSIHNYINSNSLMIHRYFLNFNL